MSADVIHPKFHHVNFKTNRLQEMIDWYTTLVGAEVLFQYPLGAWLSNDAANHRIALTAFPNLVDDDEKDDAHRAAPHRVRVRRLRAAQRELSAAQGRRDRAGLLPRSRHDVLLLLPRSRTATTSSCRSTTSATGRSRRAFMRESPEFHEDPIGKFVDPDRVAEAYAAGASFTEIHARAIAGELAPETPPLQVPQVEA